MLLCIGLIIAGVVFGFNGSDEIDLASLDKDVIAKPGDDLEPSVAKAADENFSRAFEVVPKQEKEANAAILKYESENEKIGTGPEVEANLYRLGNIYYSMKFDYEKAIYCHSYWVYNFCY